MKNKTLATLAVLGIGTASLAGCRELANHFYGFDTLNYALKNSNKIKSLYSSKTIRNKEGNITKKYIRFCTQDPNIPCLEISEKYDLNGKLKERIFDRELFDEYLEYDQQHPERFEGKLQKVVGENLAK